MPLGRKDPVARRGTVAANALGEEAKLGQRAFRVVCQRQAVALLSVAKERVSLKDGHPRYAHLRKRQRQTQTTQTAAHYRHAQQLVTQHRAALCLAGWVLWLRSKPLALTLLPRATFISAGHPL